MIPVMVVQMAPGPWAFGWTAIAGVATAVLAGFTWWLALSTRKLATETDEDIQANWRPILTPTGIIDVFLSEDLPEDRFRVRLVFALSNSGKGPAINAKVHGLRSRNASGPSWEDATASLIPSAGYDVMNIEGAVPLLDAPSWDTPKRFTFVVNCEDVGRNMHRSSFVLRSLGWRLAGCSCRAEKADIKRE